MRRLFCVPIIFFVVILTFVCSVDVHAQVLSAKDIMNAQQSGQNNNLQGSNPYENIDEEGEEGRVDADTTKKERKIRKPLESYFFSDSIRALENFKWNINKDVNRVNIGSIDTTLTKWRIDYPFNREGVGSLSLGALGQSAEAMNYFDRAEYFDFNFAQSYDSYIYNMENVPFYNVKKPVILLTYYTFLGAGQKNVREENFAIMHAQNISPTTGFNVDYKSRGTGGMYVRSKTKNHNLSVAVSHTGKRYSIHAGYINNSIAQEENGGVVGDWAVADTTFSLPSGVPMRLANAEANNVYRNNSFYVKQSYGIPLQRVTDYDFSIADLSTVFFGHTFEYNSWNKVYTDIRAPYTDERGDRNPETGEFIPVTDIDYYNNWYINPIQTRDSLNERVISNRLFVQAQPWDRDGVVGVLDGGIGFDLHTYSQLGPNSYMSGEYVKTKKTSYFVYGGVVGKIKKYVDWDANVKFYPTGYRGGDLNIGANLALKGYINGKPLILEGRFKMDRHSPNYWQENLFSNHFIWFTPLSKETETRFEVKFSIPDYAFEIGAWQGVVNNKIYYGADSEIAQYGGNVSLTSAYARKDFRFGGFHLDNKVLLQWSTNQEVIPVPLLSAYLSYYYEFWVVRDVLRLQVGLDGRYNTDYYAPGYNPALSQFYNQREVEVGNYPYLDAFITGKWKRMRIFMKYQHVNMGLFGEGGYFSAARYPLNEGMFKLGISWGFYD